MTSPRATGSRAAGTARPPAVRLWPRASATGAENMALDEAAMAVARGGEIVVRVYGWEPPCISLGRNQPAAARFGDRARDALVPGRNVVRRPTGGRSVFHGPELTYAVAAPERFLGGPKEIYRAVHEAIRSALAGIGVPLDGVSAPAPGALALDDAECFRAPAPGEILADGRKLVGSAQWRHAGAVLQHGSILILNEQARVAPGPGGGGGAVGLAELMNPGPAPGALAVAVEAALAGLSATAPPEPEPPPPDVLERAQELAARYRSSAWTWRR